MKLNLGIAVVLLNGSAWAETAAINSVNGAISVAAYHEAGNLTTVNGSVEIGEHAAAFKVRTVNGSVTLDAVAKVIALTTVNGDLKVGPGARIATDATSVNGAMTLAREADIGGRISTVNGKITLDAAHVGHGIESVSGAITIGTDSRVEGGILVHGSCSKGWLDGLFGSHCDAPLIVIAPGAVVKGTLRFERKVKLYVSDSATVGTIEGAQAIIYSGTRAPL